MVVGTQNASRTTHLLGLCHYRSKRQIDERLGVHRHASTGAYHRDRREALTVDTDTTRNDQRHRFDVADFAVCKGSLVSVPHQNEPDAPWSNFHPASPGNRAAMAELRPVVESSSLLP